MFCHSGEFTPFFILLNKNQFVLPFTSIKTLVLKKFLETRNFQNSKEQNGVSVACVALQPLISFCIEALKCRAYD